MNQTSRFTLPAVISVAVLQSTAANAIDSRALEFQRAVHYDTPPHFVTSPRPTRLPDGSVHYTLKWSDAARHEGDSWAGGCAVFENPVGLEGYTAVVVDLEASSGGVFEIKLEAMDYTDGQRNFERQFVKQGRHSYTLPLSGISRALSSNFQKVCVGGKGTTLPPGAGSVELTIHATKLIRGGEALLAESSSDTNLDNSKDRIGSRDGAGQSRAPEPSARGRLAEVPASKDGAGQSRAPEPSARGRLAEVLAVLTVVLAFLWWLLFHPKPRYSVKSNWTTQELLFKNESDLCLRVYLQEQEGRWSRTVDVDAHKEKPIAIPRNDSDPNAGQDVLLRIWYTAFHKDIPIRWRMKKRFRFGP
jgi:hypothetical protein